MVSGQADAHKRLLTFQLRRQSGFLKNDTFLSPNRVASRFLFLLFASQAGGRCVIYVPGDHDLADFCTKPQHGQEELEELRESFIGRMRQEKVAHAHFVVLC